LLYNISKIPDIYDTIRHDIKKNKLIFLEVDHEVVEKLHKTAKFLAHFIVINEYGISDAERLQIA
jgi:hypothetical protein